MSGKYTDPHPRLIKSNPWNSVEDSIGELVDKIILDMNPQTLDDDIPDVLDDWDNRVNAMEYLVEKLQKEIKGE